MFHLSSLLLSFLICQQLSKTEDSLLFHKGYSAYLKENFIEAEDFLSKHNNMYPTSKYNARVLLLLGEINFKKEEYIKAIEYWRKLNQIYPESDYAIWGLIGIGDAYLKSKRYDTALKAYQQAKKLNLSDELSLEVDLKICECQYHRGRFSSLIEALEYFVNTHSDTTKSSSVIARTMLRIARIHIENKEYYSALAMLQRLQDTYSESPVISEALFEQANIYKLLGENEGYKKTLMLISAKDTADFYPYALIELAMLYAKENRYDSSLHYWVLLQNNEKYKDMALKEIANIYYKMGFFDEAIIVIHSLIKEFPESKFCTEAYLLWVGILKNQGEFKRAEALLNEMLNKYGVLPEILLELGNIYYELNDYPNALKSYLQASEAFKDKRDESAKALILAGDVALAIGDTKSARYYYLNARLIAISEGIKNIATIRINRIQ